DAGAALGQLQRGVDRAGDRLHVVLDAQQEAGDGLAALLLAGVEEGRRGGLEPAGDDLVDHLERELLVAVGERERDHDDAVLEALEVALPVERLERVGRVVLERAEERLEAELLRVGVVEDLLEELERVLVEHLALVVAVLDEVVQLLPQVVEEDRVLVDVLQEVLPRRLLVLVELDLAVGAVQVEERVEGVVVHLALLDRGWCDLLGLGQRGSHSRSIPSRTLSTSSVVPRSSNLYRWGTPHFAAMMSPAMQ